MNNNSSQLPPLSWELPHPLSCHPPRIPLAAGTTKTSIKPFRLFPAYLTASPLLSLEHDGFSLSGAAEHLKRQTADRFKMSSIPPAIQNRFYSSFFEYFTKDSSAQPSLPKTFSDVLTAWRAERRAFEVQQSQFLSKCEWLQYLHIRRSSTRQTKSEDTLTGSNFLALPPWCRSFATAKVHGWFAQRSTSDDLPSLESVLHQLERGGKRKRDEEDTEENQINADVLDPIPFPKDCSAKMDCWECQAKRLDPCCSGRLQKGQETVQNMKENEQQSPAQNSILQNLPLVREGSAGTTRFFPSIPLPQTPWDPSVEDVAVKHQWHWCKDVESVLSQESEKKPGIIFSCSALVEIALASANIHNESLAIPLLVKKGLIFAGRPLMSSRVCPARVFKAAVKRRVWSHPILFELSSELARERCKGFAVCSTQDPSDNMFGLVFNLHARFSSNPSEQMNSSSATAVPVLTKPEYVAKSWSSLADESDQLPLSTLTDREKLQLWLTLWVSQTVVMMRVSAYTGAVLAREVLTQETASQIHFGPVGSPLRQKLTEQIRKALCVMTEAAKQIQKAQKLLHSEAHDGEDSVEFALVRKQQATNFKVASVVWKRGKHIIPPRSIKTNISWDLKQLSQATWPITTAEHSHWPFTFKPREEQNIPLARKKTISNDIVRHETQHFIRDPNTGRWLQKEH